MADPAAPAADAPASDYEARLPEPQRWANRFCENWIFAFLVAMAIRHFALEAFRIPTGSMEPMLYGDPGFLKGDHVVVDKLLFRFRGVQRWDVTVFQFPQPEIESGDGARPAVNEDGKRIDVPLLKPLMYRNFVKRCLAIPGDTFFIAGGDLHLKGADGSFAPARKPAHVQEAIWQEIYAHGAQKDYLPWLASSGAGVASEGDRLSLRLGENGVVEFVQPFRNLYVKPGPVDVRRMPNGERRQVQVSLTAPQFAYDGETGNIWHLDQWEVFRLTSADLDNRGYGSLINTTQDEWVGDVRIRGRVASLEGQPTLSLRLGRMHGVRLTLSAQGWRIDGLEGMAAEGPLAMADEPVLGRELRFAHLDGQYLLAIDGREVARIDAPSVDSSLHRLSLTAGGSGALSLQGMAIDRDVHYAANWVLSNAVDERRDLEQKLRQAATPAMRDELKSRLDDVSRVRAMFGAPPRDDGPWGVSESTAVTAPPDAYLMLGDNSPTSWDARAWGWVPGTNLRGRAIAVVLPPGRWRVVR